MNVSLEWPPPNRCKYKICVRFISIFYPRITLHIVSVTLYVKSIIFSVFRVINPGTILSSKFVNENEQPAENSSSTVQLMFIGRTFALFGFSEERTLELARKINEAGGITAEMNDLSTTVSYLVVPVAFSDFSDCHYKSLEMVSDLWVVGTFHLCGWIFSNILLHFTARMSDCR